MKKKHILAAIGLLTCLNIWAQFTITYQAPKTPEVTQFERYGNVPISIYNGRINFNIPLHTINYGDIQIPLSISYNSNGIRVNEEASEVGLGWYFGSGLIAQTIQGKDDLRLNHDFKFPDYYDTPYAQYVFNPQPDWYNSWVYYDQYKAEDPYDTDRILLNPTIPTNDTYSMVQAGSEGGFGGNIDVMFPYNGNLEHFYKEDLTITNPTVGDDTERDIFKANFFGHSISFYKAGGVYRIIDDDRYKINHSVVETTDELSHKWEIIAPDGITYVFEEELISSSQIPLNVGTSSVIDRDNEYETGTETATILPKYNNNPYWRYSRSWKITKIIDTKGHEVIFHYGTLSNIVSRSSTSGKAKFIDLNINISSRQGGFTSTADGPISDSSGGYGQEGPMAIFSRHSSQLTTERSKLTEIEFSNSKLVFEHTTRDDIPGGTKISGINLYEGTSLVREIDFQYSYFNPNHTEAIQKRLKLDGVQIADKSYQFLYHGNTLPDKNSNDFDYWGFYNGMSNTSDLNDPFRLFENSSAIPSWVNGLVGQISGKANRSAHPDHSKAGILEKIIYPTGGSTEIVYELNEFDNFFFPNHDNKLNFNGTIYLTDYTQSTSKGYGLRVKELIDKVDNEIAKRTRYTYTGGKHIAPYIPYYQEPFRDIKLSVGVDGGGKYAYKTVSSGSCVTANFSNIYQSNLLGNGEGVGYDQVTIETIDPINSSNNGKTINFFTNVPDANARTKFGLGGTVPSSYNDLFGQAIRNTDEDNGLLTTKVVLDSSNDTIQKTEFEYNSIVPEINYTLGSESSYNFNVKVVSIGKWANAELGSGTSPIYREFDRYLFFYYPLKQTKTLTKSKKVTNYFAEGTVEISENYFYDDAYRKVREYSYNSKEGYTERVEVQTSYFNSTTFSAPYGNMFLPSIVTDYRGTDEIGYKQYLYSYPNPGGNYIQLNEVISCKDNPNTTNLTIADCSHLEYTEYDDKGNLIEFRANDGAYTTIIWGYDQRFPIAKIENASYLSVQTALGSNSSSIATLQALSDADDSISDEDVLRSALNNLRDYLPSAMITTYTHDPLIGVTSVTDPRGYTTYYEYDAFNRLEYVRDADNNLLTENKYHYKN